MSKWRLKAEEFAQEHLAYPLGGQGTKAAGRVICSMGRLDDRPPSWVVCAVVSTWEAAVWLAQALALWLSSIASWSW